MSSGIPKTTDPWVLYYWLANELRLSGFNNDFISKVLGKLPYVPRGTCSSCGQAMPSPKAKRTEVFKNVAWVRWPLAATWESYVIYPNINIDKKRSFLDKPPMKMTLEWEE